MIGGAGAATGAGGAAGTAGAASSTGLGGSGGGAGATMGEGAAAGATMSGGVIGFFFTGSSFGFGGSTFGFSTSSFGVMRLTMIGAADESASRTGAYCSRATIAGDVQRDDRDQARGLGAQAPPAGVVRILEDVGRAGEHRAFRCRRAARDQCTRPRRARHARPAATAPLLAHSGAYLTDRRIGMRVSGQAVEVRGHARRDAGAPGPLVGGHQVQDGPEDRLEPAHRGIRPVIGRLAGDGGRRRVGTTADDEVGVVLCMASSLLATAAGLASTEAWLAGL